MLLYYFHSALSNHLSIAISMSPELMVAYNRFNYTTYSFTSVIVLLGVLISEIVKYIAVVIALIWPLNFTVQFHGILLSKIINIFLNYW